MLFPNMNIIIDRMAPQHLKGSYFGAFSLGVIGFALAPLVGGSLLYWYGGITLWMVMTALALVVAGLFLLTNRFSDRAL